MVVLLCVLVSPVDPSPTVHDISRSYERLSASSRRFPRSTGEI